MMPNVFAEDLMATDYETIDVSDSVSYAAHKLSLGKRQYLIVLKNGHYVGIFGYRQIARFFRRDAEKIKIGNYVFHSPSITKKTAFIDIADQMHRYNLKVLPVIENDEILGVVTLDDVVKTALTSEHLKKKKIIEFMTPGIITIKHDEIIAKAVKIIIEKDISRLPILDDAENITGVLTSNDILFAFHPRQKGYDVMRGYFTGVDGASKATVNSSVYSYNILSNSKTQVSAFASDTFLIRTPNDFIADSFIESEKINTDFVIVKENNKIVGILTYKDLLPFIANFKEKKDTIIQISGLDNENIDEFETIEITRMIKNAVSKLSNIIEIYSFGLHVKTYHKTNMLTKYNEHEKGLLKYSLRLKVFTNVGLFVARENGRDLIDDVAKLLNKAERLIKDEKKHKTRIIRNHWRNAKYMQNELPYILQGELQ